MNQPVRPAPPASAAIPTLDRTINAAIQRCCGAYYQALAAAGGPKTSAARDAAEEAFRRNAPWAVDRPSTAAFIACITHGMVLRVFWRDDGTRLISAARAALVAFPPPPVDKAATRPVGR
ncbi:MAG TPA: hypothetical protein VGL22_06010, partial [Terracidiphilus sp.]